MMILSPVTFRLVNYVQETRCPYDDACWVGQEIPLLSWLPKCSLYALNRPQMNISINQFYSVHKLTIYSRSMLLPQFHLSLGLPVVFLSNNFTTISHLPQARFMC
jgi:hypothetical protein